MSPCTCIQEHLAQSLCKRAEHNRQRHYSHDIFRKGALELFFLPLLILAGLILDAGLWGSLLIPQSMLHLPWQKKKSVMPTGEVFCVPTMAIKGPLSSYSNPGAALFTFKACFISLLDFFAQGKPVVGC